MAVLFYLENNLCQIPQGGRGGSWTGGKEAQLWRLHRGAPCLSHFISIPGVSFRSNLMPTTWPSYLLHYLVTFTSFAQDYERAGAAQSPLQSPSSFFYSANFCIVVVAADSVTVTVVALICMTFGCAQTDSQLTR